MAEKDNADWCDENVKIVCEIFAEEVRAKNRSGSHLNKLGYANVIAKFKERTGKITASCSSRTNGTSSKEIILIGNNWEKKQDVVGTLTRNYMLQLMRGGKKIKRSIGMFREKSLQNEDELSSMFEDLRNTGDDHWAPTSGEIPQDTEELHDDDENANMEHDNEDVVCLENDGGDDTPSSSKAKRRRVVEKEKGKRAKTTRGQWMQDQMAKIVQLNEKTTASCESMVLARTQETPGCSIKDVMELVKACGATVGSKEHFIATQVFAKKAEREMFLTLETPEERFPLLSMKYEWMSNHMKG